MKPIILALLALLTSTATAQHCKVIRIKDRFPQLCSDSGKVGDQDEDNKCSDDHKDSCYKVSSPTDLRCNMYIYRGEGCSEGDPLITVLPCVQGQSFYNFGPANYVVRCP